jgi:formylglycine-generating enzyme required for sulfatase activity
MRFPFILTVIACSLLGADPEILKWSVATDSFTIISKSTTYDTAQADSSRPFRIDTITNIAWNGHGTFSCKDDDNDSMGVFIDMEIGSDTIQADSVWGAPTVVPGNDYQVLFAFRSVISGWSGRTPARVRLSLDDVYHGYKGKPKITAQPENVSTLLGLPARFSVTATGAPSPDYRWRFNGVAIAGATAAEFLIAAVDTTDVGRYSVTVSNAIGKAVSQTVTLMVNYAPIITLQPQPDTVDAGKSVGFTVAGTGFPKPTVQWKKNGDGIPAASSPELIIQSVSKADSGIYTAVLSNIIGNTTSAAAVLTVNYPPVFTAQPKSVSARSRQCALFSVKASGRPSPEFLWRKNGNAFSGAVHGNFGIPAVSTGDTGYYSVVISNRLGSVTSDSARLSLDTSVFISDSMISIAGGTFQMGKLFLSDPVHEVTLTAFKMGNTFVTQKEYLRVMGINPSRITGDLSCPVENVTWFDAVLYCNRRSVLEGKDTVYAYNAIAGTPGNGATGLLDLAADFSKNGYRLPTEAEWEYACRAGTSTDYYWGGSYPPLTIEDTTVIDCNAVWYHNSGNRTQPVGSKRPNPWGFYDIVGQLWQWHHDWDGPYTAGPQTDPIGLDSAYSRNVRGGSWSAEDDDRHLRSMARNGGYFPDDRSWIIGFRVVCR